MTDTMPTCSLIRGDGIGPEIADATLRALDAAGKRLFVAALGNNTVEVIDLAAKKRIRSLAGMSKPTGVLYLAETDRILVALNFSPEPKLVQLQIPVDRVIPGVRRVTVQNLIVGGEKRMDPSLLKGWEVNLPPRGYQVLWIK